MAAVLSAAAQKHYDSNIALGFKGGVALCRTQFRPTVPQAWLPGMLLGVSFRYIEEKHFGLIAELNFEQRGWKETFEKTSLQYQRRLTYIQLPVLTHIYFGTSRFKFFANLGPEIGFMIGNSISSHSSRSWKRSNCSSAFMLPCCAESAAIALSLSWSS